MPPTPFAADILTLVHEHGLWMLFLLAMAETSFATGVVVASGVATAVATILALDGHLSLPLVAAAAAGGGWAGDTLGFWIGRRGGEWLAKGEGRAASLYRRRRGAADRIFRRHPVVSVSLARLMPFVRSVMPLVAGVSQLTYRRFLAYEALGLGLWVSLYMSIGFFAGESWETATQVLGIGGALALMAVVWLLWKLIRGHGVRVRERMRVRQGKREKDE